MGDTKAAAPASCPPLGHGTRMDLSFAGLETDYDSPSSAPRRPFSFIHSGLSLER